MKRFPERTRSQIQATRLCIGGGFLACQNFNYFFPSDDPLTGSMRGGRLVGYTVVAIFRVQHRQNQLISVLYISKYATASGPQLSTKQNKSPLIKRLTGKILPIENCDVFMRNYAYK